MKILRGKKIFFMIAGTLCSFILLLAMLPVSASAVEYTDLVTIKRGLTYPTDVAVSGDGKIYIVDGLAKKVFTYNSGYILTGSVSSLENPTAVAVFGNTVFIADNTTKSVKRFTGSGAYAGDLKKNGARATFKLPRNIAVDASGSIYVVDEFAGSIEVFNAAGSYVYTVSGLNMPQDAVVVENKLFIIDQLVQGVTVKDEYGFDQPSEQRLSRVQIYNLETRSFINVDVFSNPGTNTAEGEYISLKGITTDKYSNIYLNDSFLNVIYKYAGNGDFIGIIDEPVLAPLGATISQDGRLVVASSYEGAVKVLGIDAAAGAQSWLKAPVADAGPDLSVRERATFILDGSGSADSDVIVAYQWTQKSGPNVLPVNPYVTDSGRLPLTAPDVGPEGAEMLFELVVTDVHSLASAAATTTVTVSNVINGFVTINDGALYTTVPLVNLTFNAPDAVEMRFANDDESFSTIFYTYMPEVQWTLSDGDGIKYVKVEFRDAGGNVSEAVNSIILDTETPAAPAIIDGDGVPGNFDWQPVEGAVSYTLQYSYTSDFSDGTVTTITGLTFTGLTISLADLAPGTWHWRVRAIDAAGNAGAWAVGDAFEILPDCTDAVPETPLLANPCNNKIVSRTPTLMTNSMNYYCGGHERTKWQVSLNEFKEDDSETSSLVMNVGTTLENLTSYRIPALVLDPDKTYFWRVKQTADNGAESAWSESCLFTTENSMDIEGESGVLYVKPDPDTDTSTEEIAIKEMIGDAGIKIKVVRVSSGVIARIIKEIDPETVTDVDSEGEPDSFPLGLLSFRLTVEPGAEAQVEVTFSGAVPKDAEWYIYTAEEGWHPYTGAIFSRNRRSVVLDFVDGGFGDTDGVANGVIVNP